MAAWDDTLLKKNNGSGGAVAEWRASRPILQLVLMALVGCSSPAPIPPPTEVGPRIEAVREAVWKNEGALDGGSIENSLALLEQTVANLANSYGEQSVETIQALTETASLLATRDRFDLALPFMEQALALSHEVYGLDHRETAYGLHDVAVLLCESTSPGVYLQRAELLFRGALAVRRRQAGIDHPETAASEAQLAWQLLLGAYRESLPYRKRAMLTEAEQLAIHAQDVFTANKDQSYSMKIHRIAIETAFARADYAEVEQRARALLAESDYVKGPGLYPEATATDLLAKASKLRASAELEDERR